MRPLTLLLLSGGGHTGTNVMASLATRRENLRMVATSDTPDEPALFRFDAAYLAPKLADDPAAFQHRVLEIMARENPHLVIPCRDEDVEWLSRLGEHRPELATRFLCGSPRMAAVINDKWLSYEFAMMQGLPFAPSLPCIDDGESAARVARFVGEHGLPLVAKPRQGKDSMGVLILTTLAQALSAMQRPDYLLQKYLGTADAPVAYSANVEKHGIPLIHSFEGIKRSLQALIGPDGTVQHVVCTRNHRIGYNARRISMDEDTTAHAIGEMCARAFAQAQWRGPLNIQCQPAADGNLMIHEFNARFTGATGARWHIGHDELGAAVRAFTGEVLPPAFAWTEAPDFALEGLMPRAVDRGWVRTLAECGEWMREGM